MADNGTIPIDPVNPADNFIPGDIAWVLVSTAFVMMMTFGLAFFYGSLVREHQIADTLFKTIISMGVVTVQWVLFGYSFAFGTNNEFWGDFRWGGFIDLGDESVNDDGAREQYAPSVTGLTFAVFQMSFAVITPSLITGAVVGRMKFTSFIVFLFLWATLVYDPIAHWVWSIDGWLHKLGALDFAGGSVVHISSGFSALVAAFIVGKRPKMEREDPEPHLPFNLLGASMLWLGWLFFNGGSALSAGHVAALALTNTQICAGTSMVTWAIIDYAVTKKNNLEGALYGAVVGLVIITPGCGYVYPGYTIIMGAFGAAISYLVLWSWKKCAHLRVCDDSLYVFCSHGIGGVIGAFMTGLFATTSVNSAGANGAFYGRPILIVYQLADIGATAAWSVGITALILYFLKFTLGLRSDSPTTTPETSATEMAPSKAVSRDFNTEVVPV